MDRNQEELGIHILENVRNELYYYFPYLDGAFACISGKGSEADQNHWNRRRVLPFFSGISAGSFM